MTRKQYVLTIIACAGVSIPKLLRSDSTSNQADLTRNLITAVTQNNPNTVQELLDAGADPNSTDAVGEPALLWATCNQNPAIVEMLLKAGADPNLSDPRNQTPLLASAFDNTVQIAKILLRYGANPLPEETIEMFDRGFNRKSSLGMIQDKISQERRQALGQWAEHIDEEHDVPRDLQRLMLRDVFSTPPEQMPFK